MRANLIVTLISLGEFEAVSPFLRHTVDETLRNHVIRRLGPARAPIKVFQACLSDTAFDADVRQALVLALGFYAPSSVSRVERGRLETALCDIYVTDRDVGIHSAAESVLRQWNVPLPKAAAFRNSANRQRHGDWLITSWGKTMAVLDYPESYSPKGATSPPPGHRFAIATKEVTVEEFARFRPTQRVDYRARHDRSCPANTMDWYAAAAYCNWLNELEGIPPQEWCYGPNEDGDFADGMSIAADFLARRGYRLPLAAEWMFAASAGTETPCFFGTDGEMLTDYGWFAANSQGMLYSVGSLRPNPLGMFDVYGNVKEWSHSLESESGPDVVAANNRQRAVLGGAFAHFQHMLETNYAKHGNPPALRENYNGFRIARTILPNQR